jgi:hypothetical protein
MLVKMAHEKFLIGLEIEEANELVEVLANAEHMTASAWALVLKINELWWAEHGMNINEDMAPFTNLIEWGDEEEGE